MTDTLNRNPQTPARSLIFALVTSTAISLVLSTTAFAQDASYSGKTRLIWQTGPAGQQMAQASAPQPEKKVEKKAAKKAAAPKEPNTAKPVKAAKPSQAEPMVLDAPRAKSVIKNVNDTPVRVQECPRLPFDFSAIKPAYEQQAPVGLVWQAGPAGRPLPPGQQPPKQPKKIVAAPAPKEPKAVKPAATKPTPKKKYKEEQPAAIPAKEAPRKYKRQYSEEERREYRKRKEEERRAAEAAKAAEKAAAAEAAVEAPVPENPAIVPVTPPSPPAKEAPAAAVNLEEEAPSPEPVTPPPPPALPSAPPPPPKPGDKAQLALPLPEPVDEDVPPPPAPKALIVPPPPSAPESAPVVKTEEAITPPPPPPPALPVASSDEPAPAATEVPKGAVDAKPSPSELGKPSLRIVFKPTETAVPLSIKNEMSSLVERLKDNEDERATLIAYASGVGDQSSTSRRVSLSRALSVRSSLIEQGISPLRINLLAEGDKNPGGEPDRVDIFLRKTADKR